MQIESKDASAGTRSGDRNAADVICYGGLMASREAHGGIKVYVRNYRKMKKIFSRICDSLQIENQKIQH